MRFGGPKAHGLVRRSKVLLLRTENLKKIAVEQDSG